MKYTLNQYVRDHGQTETAKRSGFTQGAIWQMLNSQREINVYEKCDGTLILEEKKILIPIRLIPHIKK